MISIYTITMGRELYLKRLISSIMNNIHYSNDFEYYIGFQGVKPSDNLLYYIENFKKICPNIYLEIWDSNCGSGEANNKIIPKLNGDIIVKLDDDALIQSSNYFEHIKEINRLIPNSIFSPFPVGLINNLGGVLSNERRVIYGENTDIYYTLRKVNHIGGFGRISPSNICKQYTWPYDLSEITSGNEDTNFSNFCKLKNIDMYYLENSIIIEHQESTLGQIERKKRI